MENPNEVFLMALTVPDYARPEYFKKKQIESGYSEEVFQNLMRDSYKFYYDEMHKNDWRWKWMEKNKDFEVKRTLTMVRYVPGHLGHFGEDDIYSLLIDVEIGLKLLGKTEELTKDTILRIAHKENGGRLTGEQVEDLAKKHGKSIGAMKNFYRDILPNL